MIRIIHWCIQIYLWKHHGTNNYSQLWIKHAIQSKRPEVDDFAQGSLSLQTTWDQLSSIKLCSKWFRGSKKVYHKFNPSSTKILFQHYKARADQVKQVLRSSQDCCQKNNKCLWNWQHSLLRPRVLRNSICS